MPQIEPTPVTAKPPRFQFTIKGMLLATFWIAVSAWAWTFVIRPKETDPFVAELVDICRILCPCVAVGALFGRVSWGFVIGAAITLGVTFMR